MTGPGGVIAEPGIGNTRLETLGKAPSGRGGCYVFEYRVRFERTFAE
jgi:hypothetical protein